MQLWYGRWVLELLCLVCSGDGSSVWPGCDASEQPFTHASGQPMHVKGICYPELCVGEEGGPNTVGQGTFKALGISKPFLSVEQGRFLDEDRRSNHGSWRRLQSCLGFCAASQGGVGPMETRDDGNIGGDEPAGSLAMPAACAPLSQGPSWENVW